MFKNDHMTLYNDDCLSILPTIPDKSVNLVLTDIPYNEVNRDSGGLRTLDKGGADNAAFNMDILMSELNRVCSGWIVVFCGTKQITTIIHHMEKYDMKMIRVGAWTKTNPSPMNGQHGYISGLEFCVLGKFKNATFNGSVKKAEWSHPSGKSKIHATEKPESLFKEIMLDLTNDDDIVLDCFMGSGTTGSVALKNNRKFIGIELDETYYKHAEQRIIDANPIANSGLFG